MRRNIVGVFTVILLSLMLASCSKNNPVSPIIQPEQGKLIFALDASDNIASGIVTITKGDLTYALPIRIVNHTASVEFPDIQVGTWSIVVQLFDADGVEIYSGSGEAVVTKNQTTTVTIQAEHNTGNLVIIVEVPGIATPTPAATPIVIDDFESYSIGQPIAGQGEWTGTTPGPIVLADNIKGNIIRSYSTGLAQWANLEYAFQFNSSTSQSYLQFAGMISRGSGNNCQSRADIYPVGGSGTHKLGFGFEVNPTRGNYYTTLVESKDGPIYGNDLLPDTWYIFRLEIDWTQQAPGITGVATLKYREYLGSQWSTATGLENIPLEADPTTLHLIRCRMDGISGRLGYLDDIIVYYGE